MVLSLLPQRLGNNCPLFDVGLLWLGREPSATWGPLGSLAQSPRPPASVGQVDTMRATRAKDTLLIIFWEPGVGHSLYNQVFSAGGL